MYTKTLSADPSALLDELTSATTDLASLNQTYQSGGLTAIVEPAIPYIIAYAVGIALLSSILTNSMAKRNYIL